MAKLKDTIIDITTDVCEVIIPPQICPSCIPNPKAIVPDWTTLDQTEPFLNEKTCEYSITVETNYKTIEGDTQLAVMLAGAVIEGVTNLISYYDKNPIYEVEPGINVHQLLIDKATPADITNLEFYVNSKHVPIKVLITIPASILDSIPSISELPEDEQPSDEDQDDEDTSEEASKPLEVFYDPKTLRDDIDTLLNGLLYLSFLFDKARIKQKAVLRVFSLIESHHHMKKYTNNIFDFLRDNLIVNFEKVDGIKIYYKEDFSRIKKIEVKKIGCDYKEVKGKKMTYLNSSPMTNSINNILFSQMEQMVSYFETSGEKSSWEEFVTRFLPPEISENLVKESPAGENSFNFESSSIPDSGSSDSSSSTDCKNLQKVKDKAKQAFKKVGRNVTNEIIAYPEAVWNEFTEELCESLRKPKTTEEYLKFKAEREKRKQNVEKRVERLKDAKLRELCADDSLLSELIFNLLGKYLTKPGAKEEDNACAQISSNQKAQSKQDDKTKVTNYKELNKNFLSKISACTVLGIIKESLDCVAKGMGEDDLILLGLKSIIKAIDGEEKLKQILNSLPEEMENGFRQALEQAKGSGIYPWETDYKGGGYDQGNSGPTGLIPEEEINSEDVNEDNFIIGANDRPPGKLIIQTEQGPYRVDTTHNGIVKNFASAGTLGILADDLIDVFVDYALGWLDSAAKEQLSQLKESLSGTAAGRAVFEILNFATALIKDNECAIPPLFDPPLKDLAKTLTYDPCTREPAHWTPPVRTKYKSIQPWDDFYHSLRKTALDAVEDLAFGAFKLLLGKALSTSVNLACEAISSATANFIIGGCNLKSLFQKSLCGEEPEEGPYGANTDDESIAAAANEIADAIGAWDGTTKPTNECMQEFIDSISSALTNGEMKSLLNGNATTETLKMVFSLAKTLPGDCNMINIFSSPDQFGSLFAGLGNLIDDDLINEALSGDHRSPFNSDLCKDPSSLKDFDDLRKQISERKGLTPEQAQRQLDQAKQRNFDAASDLLDALLNPDNVMDPRSLDPKCKNEDGTTQNNKLKDLIDGKSEESREELTKDFKELFESVEISLIDDTSKYFDYVLSSKDGTSFKNAVKKLKRDLTDKETVIELFNSESIFSHIIDKMKYQPGLLGIEDPSNTFRQQIFDDNTSYSSNYYLANNGADWNILSTDVSPLSINYGASPIEINVYTEPIGATGLYETNNYLEHTIDNASSSSKIKFNFLNNNLYSLYIKEDTSEYNLTGTYAPNVKLEQYFQSSEISNPAELFVNKSQLDFERFFPSQFLNAQWEPIIKRMYLNVHKIFAGDEASDFYLHGYHLGEPNTENYSEAAMEVLGIGTPSDPAFYYSGDFADNYAGYYKNYLKLCPSPEIDSEAKFFMNYDDIAETASNNVEEFPEDDRLQAEDPSCVIEPPYGLIADSYAAASTEASLRLTLRTILTEQLMNMLHINSMTIIDSLNDGILNHVYTSALVEKVKQELIRMGDLKTYGNFYTKKTFYYNFKEQIVQSFSNRLKIGELTPTPQEQAALDIINVKQSFWKEPALSSNKFNVKAQKYSRFMNETEKYSDIILRRYIGEELSKVTKAFSNRLNPAIKNIQSLFFGNKSPDSQFFQNKHDPTNWPCNVPKNIEERWYNESYNATGASESPFILEKFVKINIKNQIPEHVSLEAKGILNSEKMKGVISIESLKDLSSSGVFSNYSFEDLFESISIGLRIVILYKSGTNPAASDELKKYLTLDTKRSARRTKSILTGFDDPEISDGSGAIASKILCSTEVMLNELKSFPVNFIFNFAIDDNYESQFPCLVNNLMETEDYKLNFEYFFPIKTLVSLAIIYHQNYFMSSLRRKKESGDVSNLNKHFFSIDRGLYENTKKVCKILFEGSYYSKYENTYDKYVKKENSSINVLNINSNLFSSSDETQSNRTAPQKVLRAPKDKKLISLAVPIVLGDTYPTEPI